MSRKALGLIAVCGCLALALPKLAEPDRSQRSVSTSARPGLTRSNAADAALSPKGPASQRAVITPSPAARSGVDPNQPAVVGDSRRLAANAVDAIARSGLDDALIGLGHRFRGSPERTLSPGTLPQERLVLDLHAFDSLSFVEQLLALANSRRVRTRTEAFDRFSDHVRQLRYGGGRVDRCARLSQPSLWAVAAQRRGYLVDLTPYLSGARQRQVSLQALLIDPALGPSRVAGTASPCRVPARSQVVSLAELPLEAMPSALPSLRSGDLFVLRGSSSDRFPDGIGLVEIRGGRLEALLVLPGRGVVRVPDLIDLARRRPGTTGIAFLRPLPNQNGRLDP